MRSATISLAVSTTARGQMVDVTDRVEQAIRKSEVREGLAIVYVPHTTAGVAINENADPDVQRDVLAKLTAMIPKDEPYYRHGEGNSDSHVKAILTGNSVTVLVTDGRLLLGSGRAFTSWNSTARDRGRSSSASSTTARPCSRDVCTLAKVRVPA